MKEHIEKIIIAKDGFPLELFKGRPITNFLRRILHADYKVCRECYKAETTGDTVLTVTAHKDE